MNVLPYIEVFKPDGFQSVSQYKHMKESHNSEQGRADNIIHTFQRFLSGENNSRFDPCEKFFEIFAIKTLSVHICMRFMSP